MVADELRVQDPGNVGECLCLGHRGSDGVVSAGHCVTCHAAGGGDDVEGYKVDGDAGGRKKAGGGARSFLSYRAAFTFLLCQHFLSHSHCYSRCCKLLSSLVLLWVSLFIPSVFTHYPLFALLLYSISSFMPLL